jgi:hypothetical protein
MPYAIKSARSNNPAKVIVSNKEGLEVHVDIPAGKSAYSMTMTRDMRMQTKMGYVTVEQLDEMPAPDKAAEVKKADSKPAGDSHGEPTVPVKLPPQFTKDELEDMKKAQLQKIAEIYKIDIDQTNRNLVKAILKAQAKLAKG